MDYACAGTVEFLVDGAGRHVFIEMNPRIQVEHTVTEEVTGIDLVAAQLRIAHGATLAELELSQESVSLRGAAIQCRVTTEDPAANFRPDTGRISVYSPPGGVGVRLDGNASVGTEITAFFDSLLVKLTCSGRDFPTAVRRARRALDEFRISGVAMNIDFLRTVLDHPEFLGGGMRTTFIDSHPELLDSRSGLDRVTKIIDYLADVTVNRPWGDRPSTARPRDKLPEIDATTELPRGSRDELRELGPAGFAAELRRQNSLGVTDTTFRDAHQSLLATRVRTSGLVAVAEHVARLAPGLWSVECWGGATYDVALRFLSEDPWERLDALREAMPNVCLQMLLRGRNTVGYTPYPVAVTNAFVDEAARSGIDIFRIFDALNDVDAMRPAIDAVLATGSTVAEVAMSFTGDLSDPNEKLYTLDYWLRLAERIVDSGAHVLAIKDMAGLLRPPAAKTLVGALRREFDLPIHVHTHDTAGGQLATYFAAVEAGADAVDGASAPMAGTTSQPSLSAIAAMVAHTERATNLDLDTVMSMEPYWESIRAVYRPFESVPPGPTGRVYHHEIPGGQLSNLRAQADALELADDFEAIEEAYAGADRALGRIIKVTPSSKVVGDLALHLVGAGVSAAEFAENPERYDIPDSVVRFFAGELGTPAGGWPEPLRSRVLSARGIDTSAASPAPPENALSQAEKDDLAESGARRRGRLNSLLFPDAAHILDEQRARYGNLSVLSAHQFFYGLYPSEENRIAFEDGPDLHVELKAISEPDMKGERTVHLVVNGQPRIVTTRDRSVESVASKSEKADPDAPGQVAAPFTGAVTVTASLGDEVSDGDKVAVIEAMKMEATISAPVSGTITRVLVPQPQQVDGADLILVIDPS